VSALPHDGVPEVETPESHGNRILSRSYRDACAPLSRVSDTGPVSVHDALLSIKEMLVSLDHSQRLPDIFHVFPEALTLYTRLVQTGISEIRAGEFIKKASLATDGRMPSGKEIRKRVYREIAASIKVFHPFALKSSSPVPGGQKFFSFIGPTGVGKTTTIAKLAAGLVLRQKKKVGLISIDSYRIGAVEQLRTYAAIIGIPCLAAFTREDVQNAVRQMKAMDTVLIDTAGHSHLNQKRMMELKQFLKWDHPVSHHLLLSAATRQEDLKEAAGHFSGLKPQTVILTKIDETRQRGGILDLILDSGLPISFVTNGQKVPDDIFAATKKSVFNLILNR